MHRNSLISVLISVVVGLTTIGSVAAQEPQPAALVEAATLTDSTGTPVSVAITYQGQLKQNGSPATGNFDFQFILYDAASSASQQGATRKVNNLAVSNGLFNVQLDFGYAMKASNDELSHGAIIGKAMTGLQDGTGLVLVLVNLQ